MTFGINKLFFIVCMAGALALCGDLNGASDDLKLIKLSIQSLEEAHLGLLNEEADLNSKASELALKINELKKKGRSRTIIEDMKLDELLKNGAQLTSKQQELDEKEKRIRASLKNVISDGLRVISGQDLTPERTALFNDLTLKLKKLEETPHPRQYYNDVHSSSLDGPRELLDKADLLSDNADKIRVECKGLRERLAEIREEIRLREETGFFIREDRFFDDNSSRRVWARNNSDGITAADPRVEKGPESIATGFGDSSPTASPVVPSSPSVTIFERPSVSDNHSASGLLLDGVDLSGDPKAIEKRIVELENIANEYLHRAGQFRAEAKTLEESIKK